MISLKIIEGQEKGASFSFDQPVITLGRSDSNDLVIPDYHLSGEHGQIFSEGQQFIYRDLHSTNGSALARKAQAGVSIDGSRQWEISLRDADRLLLGDPADPVVVEVEIPDTSVDSEIEDTLIASRSIVDLPAVTNRLEADPRTGLKIYRLLQPLSSRLNMDEALRALADACFELIPKATHIAISLRAENDADRFSLALAEHRDEAPGGDVTHPSKSVMKKLLSDQAAILLANAPEELSASESIVASQIMSIIAVPLWRGEKIRGVVQIENRVTSNMFDEQELEIAMVLASHATLALDNAALVQRLQIAESKLKDENQYLRRKAAPVTFGSIVGGSSEMQQVINQLKKVVNTRATVCIEGETGTGKELIATAVHYESNRREKLFVAQNCAALPETLLESELFGHKRGAFTGADNDKKGLFDLADGGTLFLDEVGEMPLSLQAKLLRALQEGTIRPVGATSEKQVDVRIVCATNRDLSAEVEKGNFRQDLYYRLMVFPVQLPPLRRRTSDIRPLIEYFCERYCAEYRKHIAGFSEETLATMAGYRWPGNIRELENEIQRLIIQAEDGAWLEPNDLSVRLKDNSFTSQVAAQKGTLKEMMEHIERTILKQALSEHDGNKTQTAKSLGITREGLHKKLSKFGIR